MNGCSCHIPEFDQVQPQPWSHFRPLGLLEYLDLCSIPLYGLFTYVSPFRLNHLITPIIYLPPLVLGLPLESSVCICHWDVLPPIQSPVEHI